MIIPNLISYIHIPKTGGTAIEKYFIEEFTDANGFFYNEECDARNVQFGLNGNQHRPASWYPEDLPAFATIRNPYTRALSAFNWSLQHDWFPENVDCLEQFFTEVFSPDSIGSWPQYWIHFWPQTYFLDRENIVLLEQENLQKEFSRFCEARDWPTPWLTIENRGNHSPVRNCLDENSVALIREIYQSDFKALPYTDEI
ncbi:MAG: sulfotransferase family 2 domain-containing protein [Verrucomicrobiales bacterium]|nr:sulfotransferase family 2 domain-containing protein [Verrucomicrobiales bacterium]